MSKKVKDIEIITCMYYFFGDFVDKFVVKSFILYFSKVNSYIGENNKSKYLTLVPTNESKEPWISPSKAQLFEGRFFWGSG